MDCAGPFLNRMIDAHSKWIEAYPLLSITAPTTIQCLRTIFSTHGVPEVLVSDNGPTFTSEEFAVFLKRNDKRSPAYHPSSNGLAEKSI